MSNPKNHGKPSSASAGQQPRLLAVQNTPTRLIGLKMGRTPSAVQARASDISLSLMPTNQSLYGNRGL